MPTEPPEPSWAFPPRSRWPRGDLVAVGGDELEPGVALAAYRRGLFPMPLREGGRLGWWSPDPRGILEPSRVRVSRSLHRSCRRYRIRIDEAFAEVIAGCADPARPHGWIDARMRAAYTELHRLGWAHSVEAWDDEGLAGGLYGVAIGGLFAAESKFHRRTDASKAALVALCRILDDGRGRLLDVQWPTDHLASLGATAVRRGAYLRLLEDALAGPPPPAFRNHPARRQ
jgi:leucyl/phenylalanyl-tRNA--protein transferase